MRRALLQAVLAGFLGLAAVSAYAADGQTVGVDPDAVARLSGADRILTVGADVSIGEEVVTGPSGQVQIIFSDQTRLVVGPRSTLKIEAYLFNGNTADKFAINALAGSFRFITGNSPKPVYSIKTPAVSIAIRGTKFDFNVSRARTDVLLYEGALRLCAGGSCQELIERCDLGTAAAGAAELVGWPEANHRELSQTFRYARFQTPLLTRFRVTGAGQCAQPPAEAGSALPLSTTSGESANPTGPATRPPTFSN